MFNKWIAFKWFKWYIEFFFNEKICELKTFSLILFFASSNDNDQFWTALYLESFTPYFVLLEYR